MRLSPLPTVMGNPFRVVPTATPQAPPALTFSAGNAVDPYATPPAIKVLPWVALAVLLGSIIMGAPKNPATNAHKEAEKPSAKAAPEVSKINPVLTGKSAD